MTTTVTIDAHCGDDTHVRVVVADFGGTDEDEVFYLKDGESAERHVYDDQTVNVREVPA